ncbi:MAG: hemerythrin domain-containing protein, partial [Thermoanaerobaculum sp.]|nr:hemerythrin domain-containing protein [Thermoanaerobaculum sp.]
MSQILDFIRTFADACHHGKEEDLLFPALESCGFSREVGPLAVMLVEHQRGRALVRQAAQALEAAAGGDRQAAGEVARALADWAQLIEQHIAKENRVLFPMAQEVLGEGTLRELGEAFSWLEQERFAGVHQRARQL